MGEAGNDRSQAVRVRDSDAPLERAAQHVDERLVGEQRILLRAAVQHCRAHSVHSLSELGEQPRLADPGLAGHHR